MSLQTYEQKRNFSRTREPKGGKAPGGKHIFVIQRHHASHLHYDFRLEVRGVLKSWAVPKGPSMNPADKRLAMQVEDHPYDYKDFEGEIPPGNYGAGTVYVWDKGTYELLNADGKDFDKAALQELHKGNLKIKLKGRKVKGEFALVRMKRENEDNTWLLLKHNDQYAVKTKYNSEDYTPQRIKDKGLRFKAQTKTGRKKAAPKVAAAPEAAAPKTPAQPMKKVYKPMMATLVDAPFSLEGWLFEPKWDGYRAIAAVKDGKADLYSRNQISFNKDYIPVVKAVEKIAHNVVLDGEIAVRKNSRSAPEFQALQNYRNSGKGQLIYAVFDLLHLNGAELQQMPLTARKELLKEVVKQLNDKTVIYSEHVMNKGEALFEKAKTKGWEGIIAKKADSAYEEDRRSNNWLKIKVLDQQEAIICGYTAPRGSRKKLGALVLGIYENGKLRYIGNCGGGLDKELIDMLYDKLQPLRRQTPAFNEKIKTDMPITWVKPELVCQVKFSSWTEGGHLRQPIFLGLREDKPVTEVNKETAKSLNNMPSSDTSASQAKERVLKLNGKEVTLTNQQKIYWPDEKITKGQLIDYYLSVAKYLLPHLKDRPINLHRFPNGIKGPSFYQKDLDLENTPSWIKSIPLYSASTNKDVDYLLCGDEATLAYMINLGCIEVNPWLSRIKKLDNPDYIVIDLDPEDIAFKYVVETALCVKDVLDGLGVTAHCKTSGASGLHIYIPTGAKYPYETCRLFAEYVARQAQRQLPRITSVVRAKSQRKKKVYIDFLQNSRGQTIAAPYAVRPRPGAPVATPLEWEEVNGQLKVTDFHIGNTLSRLQEKGDLWQRTQQEKNDLRKVIQQIEKAGVE